MTTSLSAAVPVRAVDLDWPSCGVLGDPGTRLLSGPAASVGPEDLDHHRARLGELRLESRSSEELRAMIAQSGLEGRGGGQFPIAAKLDLAARSRGAPLLVVNASEGEPASRKDMALLLHRPHLVLDGAMVVAASIGAREVVLYLHRSRPKWTGTVERAIAERAGDPVKCRLVDAPPRYVAGETTAVVSYLEGNGALPGRRMIPVAASGVAGRPTVVNNVETIAHVGLIARFGPAWFRESGDTRTPGSTLVTVAGDIARPLTVAEVVGKITIGDALRTIDPTMPTPRAVLVGGYEGTWISGEVAMTTPLSRGSLKAGGASLGCGLLGVLGHASCGLKTTARLVQWLAGESSGQCGQCVFGLPAITEVFSQLSQGTASRRDVRRLRLLTASVHGRGACGHPSGVVGLVDSALDTFAGEVARHLRSRPCGVDASGFPLPHDDVP